MTKLRFASVAAGHSSHSHIRIRSPSQWTLCDAIGFKSRIHRHARTSTAETDSSPRDPGDTARLLRWPCVPTHEVTYRSTKPDDLPILRSCHSGERRDVLVFGRRRS